MLKIFAIILLLSIVPATAGTQINWLTDYYTAKDLGARHNLPVVVYFFDQECSHCIEMEETFKDPLILSRQNDFIWVKIDVNDLKYHNLRQEYELQYVPTVYFLDPEGSAITYIDVYMNATRFRGAIDFAYSMTQNIEHVTPGSQVPGTPEKSVARDNIIIAFSIILIAIIFIRIILPQWPRKG